MHMKVSEVDFEWLASLQVYLSDGLECGHGLISKLSYLVDTKMTLHVSA